MNEIDTLTTFFGWCSVLNIGLLTLTTIVLMFLREPIVTIHARLFGLNRDKLPLIYIQYLGSYKIAILIFNLVPYIALKVMS